MIPNSSAESADLTPVRQTISTSPSEAEARQRLTCKWLCFTTILVVLAVASAGFLVPDEFYNSAIRFELWHGSITAALLLWGWRSGGLGLLLAEIAVGAGILYLTPLVFLVGMVLVMPTGNVIADGEIPMALVYFGSLFVYYGGALMFLRRARRKARPAPSR